MESPIIEESELPLFIIIKRGNLINLKEVNFTNKLPKIYDINHGFSYVFIRPYSQNQEFITR